MLQIPPKLLIQRGGGGALAAVARAREERPRQALCASAGGLARLLELVEHYSLGGRRRNTQTK